MSSADHRVRGAVELPPMWLMALSLVAVSANLRTAIASVPPLARTIATDLDLSSAWIGALTTLPVLCMGLLAPAAQRNEPLVRVESGTVCPLSSTVPLSNTQV